MIDYCRIRRRNRSPKLEEAGCRMRNALHMTMTKAGISPVRALAAIKTTKTP